MYGRDAQRRNQFSEEMSERLAIDVYPAESAAAAVRNAEIICTATTSAHPVLHGEDIPAQGVHINAIGANHAHKQELDEAAVAKANLIFVDSLAQSQQEAGDLIVPFTEQPQRWSARARIVRSGGRESSRSGERRANHAIQVKRDRGLGPRRGREGLRVGRRRGE